MGARRTIQSGVVGGLPRTPARVAMKGRLHVAYNTKIGGFVARSWPKGNGGDTPARAASRALFAAVARGVSKPNLQQYESALELARGTPFTWRDVLSSAAYGNLYIQVADDGKIWMGWRVAFATIQVLLDSILNTPGTMLVRAPEGWVALLPGDDGDVLTFDASVGIPQWMASTADVQAILDQLAPVAGNMVRFDGTTWAAVDPATLFDVSGAAATALADAALYTDAAIAAIPHTDSTHFGLAKVDGTTITASGGVISTPALASAEAYADAAVAAIPHASASTFGTAKVDGSTITASGGVISSVGLVAAAAFHPPYKTGNKYGSPALLGAAGTATATASTGTLWFTPFYVHTATTFTKAWARTQASGAQVEMGIYTDAGGVPGALIADWGQVASAAGGDVSITISQALAPGWYWLAVSTSASIALFAVGATGSAAWLMGQSSPSALPSGYSQPWVYSTGHLPAVGVLTALGANCPSLWLSP